MELRWAPRVQVIQMGQARWDALGATDNVGSLEAWGTFKGQCTQIIWLTFSTMLALIGPQRLPRWPERRVQ